MIPKTVFLLAALALALVSCSNNEEIEQHIKTGQNHLAALELSKARTAFLAANGLDHENAASVEGLAQVYYYRGQLRQAYQAFQRSAELTPGNATLTLLLADTYLRANKFPEASETALQAVQLDSSLPQALIVYAKAQRGVSASYQALQFLENAIDADTEIPEILVARAILNHKIRRHGAANALLQRAITLAPKLSEAHLAQALHASEADALQEADAAFRNAVATAPPYTPYALQYAVFKESLGQTDEALSILNDSLTKSPEHIPSRMLLAELLESTGEFEAAIEHTKAVLALDFRHPEALYLDGRLKIAAGRAADAVKTLNRLVERFSKSPKAQLQLGIAYLNENRPIRALVHLDRARALAPGNSDTNLILAGLDIHQADYTGAILTLKSYAQRYPENLDVKRFLGDTLRATGDYKAALEIYYDLMARDPQQPEVLLQIGFCYIYEGNAADAYAAFLQALEVDSSYFPAIEQLAIIDGTLNRFERAHALLETYAAEHGKNENYLHAKGILHLSQGQNRDAESFLLQAVAHTPASPRGYLALATLHISEDQTAKAVAILEAAREANASDIDCTMLLGALYERQGRPELSIACYEEVLEIDPSYNTALNNLAYIYAKYRNDLDTAQGLAETARNADPSDPSIADTLGWIKYRKHEYEWAVSLISEAASKLPKNSEVQHHFGLAHYALGNQDAARSALEATRSLTPSAAVTEDCNQRIRILDIDPATASPRERELLRTTLAAKPNDTVARLKLARIHFLDSEFEKAEAQLKHVLKHYSRNAYAKGLLAELSLAQGNPAQAFKHAKDAYSINQEAPAILRVVGPLAYQHKQFEWATDLLTRCLAAVDDERLTYLLAKSYLATGQLKRASDIASKLASSKAYSEKAQQLNELVALFTTDGEPEASRIDFSDTDEMLSDLQNARYKEFEVHASEAKSIYENLRKSYPAFTPAAAALAKLYFSEREISADAFTLASTAYYDQFGDAALALAYAFQAYHQKEYEEATNALRKLEDTDLQRLYKGLALAQRGDYENALPLLEAVAPEAIEANENEQRKEAIRIARIRLANSL